MQQLGYSSSGGRYQYRCDDASVRVEVAYFRADTLSYHYNFIDYTYAYSNQYEY